MKTRAGSSGARRTQPAARRAPDGVGAVVTSPLFSATDVMSVAPRWSAVLAGSVALGDVVRELLPPVQRLVDAHLPGDGRADVLRDLGAEVGELRDVDELDADGRTRLHARVAGIGTGDGLLRRLGERRRLLEVVRVVVRRGALAGGHPGPAELGPDEFLVLAAGRPGDELPGVVLLLAGLLDAPGPGVEPA